MPRQSDYAGPALFSYGFRPFFLAATLFGLGVVPIWLLVWRGVLMPSGPFAPVDWHVHEMIFGYGAAVVAGFLFTAVPNWTGRMPTRGWPLMALLAVWVAGRLAMTGLGGLGPVAVMGIDIVFLLAVAAMIAREIVAGKNWRNLKVLVPVSMLAVANASFHLEAMTQGSAPTSQRFGIAVLVFLIMLIGGRIVPSFTRNWLAQSGSTSRPVPFGRFDMLTLAVSVPALGLWVTAPLTVTAGVALAVCAALHLIRMLRWVGMLTLGSPLLTMLHAAYAFVPLGLFGAALAAFGMAGPAGGAHLLGIGAVGGMTLAVMMRATMGHTGRDLVSGRALNLGFLAITGAALVRVAGVSEVVPGLDGIHLSAALWTFGFLLIVRRLLPWLVGPRVATRKPSTVQQRA
ncbi:NnrS family protein [Mameliella alba]|uniref:Short-chain dehydrogenase n=1 Tax=Mameliella alba TaxID=561184 RepID=A0A0B3RI33_9RHOB|nr:NnrS family protein [Mameliella alba]KHQ50915.1 Short-chain dehydrogenase [Mameliella alba]